MTPNLPINCKVGAILKKLLTASFLGALVGDFKPKSFDDAKLELRKQFPLIKKPDHIAATKLDIRRLLIHNIYISKVKLEPKLLFPQWSQISMILKVASTVDRKLSTLPVRDTTSQILDT